MSANQVACNYFMNESWMLEQLAVAKLSLVKKAMPPASLGPKKIFVQKFFESDQNVGQKKFWVEILDQAVCIPVGRRSGGQVATALVAMPL